MAAIVTPYLGRECDKNTLSPGEVLEPLLAFLACLPVTPKGANCQGPQGLEISSIFIGGGKEGPQ